VPENLASGNGPRFLRKRRAIFLVREHRGLVVRAPRVAWQRSQ
jgi:hypothetical protein